MPTMHEAHQRYLASTRWQKVCSNAEEFKAFRHCIACDCESAVSPMHLDMSLIPNEQLSDLIPVCPRCRKRIEEAVDSGEYTMGRLRPILRDVFNLSRKQASNRVNGIKALRLLADDDQNTGVKQASLGDIIIEHGVVSVRGKKRPSAKRAAEVEETRKRMARKQAIRDFKAAASDSPAPFVRQPASSRQKAAIKASRASSQQAREDRRKAEEKAWLEAERVKADAVRKKMRARRERATA